MTYYELCLIIWGNLEVAVSVGVITESRACEIMRALTNRGVGFGIREFRTRYGDRMALLRQRGDNA
jgi:hypothetical protein